MKVDFHCHTKATKKGDSESRNIDAENFAKKIMEAEVKIVAITNHNYFNKDEFIEFSNLLDGKCLVLPGVEFDVIGINGESGHVVLFYDNNEIEKFDREINLLLDNVKPDVYSINVNDLIELVNRINCVTIAHHKKKPALNVETINYIKENIEDKDIFFSEPSNLRSACIMMKENLHVLKGTDVKDWNNYTLQEFAEIKIDINSYDKLIKFFKKEKETIESLLSNTQKFNIEIDDKNIVVYNDVNVIFGAKGSGKSFILEKIKKYFEACGKSISYYCPSENDSEILKYKEINNDERQLNKYGKSNCKEKFDYIRNWTEKNVISLNDFYLYETTKSANSKKTTMKILLMNRENEDDNINRIRDDYEKILKVDDALNEFDYAKYEIQIEDMENLKRILKLFQEKVTDKYCEKFDELYSKKLTNFSIEKLKNIVDGKTGSKSKPSSTGFYDYANEIFKFENAINTIKDGLKFEKILEPERLGNVGQNKEIFIQTKIHMLDGNDKGADIFGKNITAKKDFINLIDNIDEKIYLDNVFMNIKEKLNDTWTLDDFIGIERYFTFNEQKYELSSGEQTLICLNEKIDSNADIYILDEPEKSLGNDFVSNELVKKINELANRKKVVIMATHNANLAIRTLPYVSLLKKYDNGQYKTYKGSPYLKELVNINDDSDVLEWKKESINILEGGKEAFEERGDIYGK